MNAAKQEKDNLKRVQDFKKRQEAAHFNQEMYKSHQTFRKKQRDLEKLTFSPASPTQPKPKAVQGYDDIFNNVFKDKSKEALERQMRSTRRVDHIYSKFKDVWVD